MEVPGLQLDRQSYRVGEPVVVDWRGAAGLTLGLYQTANDRNWMQVHRSKREVGSLEGSQGTVSFDTARMEVGPYEARLTHEGSQDVVAAASLRIAGVQLPQRQVDTGGVARLHLTRSDLVTGEVLEVAFAGAAGAEGEWVGVFPPGQVETGRPIAWVHTDNTRPGFGPGPTAGTVVVRPLNLLPGSYVARLVSRDSFDPRAAAPFTVRRDTASPVPAPAGPLTVASFNIWCDGDGVGDHPHGGLAPVVDAIRKTRADLVGLQESSAERFDQILAELLKDEHYRQAQGSVHTRIISRYPFTREYTVGPAHRKMGILAGENCGAGVAIRLPGGTTIRLFNTHLPYHPPSMHNLARHRRTVEQVQGDEWASKAGIMRRLFNRLVDHPDHDPQLPTFIVGDHNTPSHLDWTLRNVAQNFGGVVDWPISRMLAEAGFVDAYRQVYPDPLTRLGHTYTPGYPKNIILSQEVQQRIDMIYFRNGTGLKLRAVQAYTHDEDPYPSDHRVLVASFEAVEGAIE
jgi:hypothetical protein